MSKKKNVLETVLVFAFMQSPHQMLAVTDTGKKVLRKEFDSEQAAKDELMTPGFLQTAKHATDGVEPEVIWIDDPAGDERVISACQKMEDDGREEAEQTELPVNSEEAAESNDEAVQDGVMVEIEQEISEDENLPQIETPVAKAQEVPTEEMVEVEVEIPDSMLQLVGAVNELKRLENERNASQADYNKQIKEQKAYIYSLTDGKARTHVKCKIEYDWENGIRKYYREDTGEFVKETQIPDEMRQMRLDLDMSEQAEVQESVDFQEGADVQESLNELNGVIAEGQEENPFEADTENQEAENGSDEQQTEEGQEENPTICDDLSEQPF